MKLHEIVRTRRTAIFYSIVVIALISAIAFVTWPESREVRRTADSTDNAFAQSPQISSQSPNNDGSDILFLEPEMPSDTTRHTDRVPEPIDAIWNRYHDAATSGNAQAAYQLAHYLDKCKSIMRSLPRDPVELKAHAEGIAAGLSTPDDTYTAQELVAMYDNCRTSQERLDSAVDWMELAADNGNIDAMLQYHHVARNMYPDVDLETRKQYRANAIDYLGIARDRGSLHAALRLSGLLVKEDPVAAYANAEFIINSLKTGRTDPGPLDMGAYIMSANQIMANISQSMSDSDYERAMLLADELLLRCCG